MMAARGNPHGNPNNPEFIAQQGQGAPKGNQNGRRAKLVRNALKEAFIELESGADDDDVKLQRRLRKYATGLIALAESGDVAAYKEINDRIDGKAAQEIAVADGGGLDDLLSAIDGRTRGIPSGG